MQPVPHRLPHQSRHCRYPAVASSIRWRACSSSCTARAATRRSSCKTPRCCPRDRQWVDPSRQTGCLTCQGSWSVCPAQRCPCRRPPSCCRRRPARPGSRQANRTPPRTRRRSPRRPHLVRPAPAGFRRDPVSGRPPAAGHCSSADSLRPAGLCPTRRRIPWWHGPS